MLQGRIARENIDLAALQLLEAFVGVERNEFGLFRIVEDRRRHRAAEIHVETCPVALLVANREAGQAGTDAAQHFAPPHRPFQGSRIISFIADGGGRDRECNHQPDKEAASECPHDSPAIIGKMDGL